LTSDTDNAAFEQAGRLLGIAHDPATEDPLRFHLLRRPEGRDVLLLQYSHALMDNTATPLLLRELARCASTSSAAPSSAEANGVGAKGRRGLDPLWGYVRRHPRQRRRAAAEAARERLVATLVHRGTMLGRPTS